VNIPNVDLYKECTEMDRNGVPHMLNEVIDNDINDCRMCNRHAYNSI